jgi:hypothetical protein
MTNPRKTPGIDELNLAEFPLTLLTNRVPPGLQEIVFKDTIIDRSTGESVERKVTVTENAKYGLPTATDQDVLVALIEHTRRTNGFTQRRVEFSLYKLLQILRWEDHGKNFKRLKESLQRWAATTIFFEDAFWERSRAKWTNVTAHILDRVVFNLQGGRRPSDPDEELLSWFDWGQDVFKSIQSGNTKSLDLEFYFNLESPAARRAYRYFDKKFHQTPRLVMNLQRLVWEHLGFARTYTDAGQLRRKLDTAYDELVKVNYLVDLPQSERYERVGSGQWNVVLLRKNSSAIPQEPVIEEPAKASEQTPIVQKLMDKGVDLRCAIALATSNDEVVIQEYLDVLQWRIDHKVTEIRSPAAFLIDSIQQKYPIPPEYSKQKRVKEEAENRRANSLKTQTSARKRRLQEDQQADQINAFLNSKSASEKEQLMEEASANSTHTLAQAKKGTPAYDLACQVIFLDHVRRLLNLPIVEV